MSLSDTLDEFDELDDELFTNVKTNLIHIIIVVLKSSIMTESSRYVASRITNHIMVEYIKFIVEENFFDILERYYITLFTNEIMTPEEIRKNQISMSVELYCFFKEHIINLNITNVNDINEEEIFTDEFSKIIENKVFELLKPIVNEDIKDEIYEENTCSICLEHFEEGKNQMIIQCGHKFHTTCMLNIFTTSANYLPVTCPNCRYEITTTQITHIDK